MNYARPFGKNRIMRALSDLRRPRRLSPSRRRFDFLARFEACESRALMTLPPVLEIPLIPEFDQFGDQILVVQGFDIPERGALGIFDSGASAVTFSGQDQAFFDMSGFGTIPIKVPGGALAEGIGGQIIGDVSEPGVIISDGMSSFNLTFDEWGFPVFEISLRPSALETPGIQTFVGTEQSPLLPTITGTPAMKPSPKYENGAAAWVRMLGAELDFSGLLPGLDSLIIPFPDLEFSQPGLTLQPDPVYGEVFDTVTYPLIPFGADNTADPGDLITESYLWMIPDVIAADNAIASFPGDFLFDTGAQLSVISTDMALSLGLDLDQPETTIDVQGVAGTMTVPGYTLDSLELPRDDGGTVRYTDVPIYVLDVAPGIDGIFGMNLMNVTSQFIFDPHHPDGAQLSVSYFSNPDRGGTIDDELGSELGALLNLLGMNVLGGALMGNGAGIPGLGMTRYNPSTSVSLTPSTINYGQAWSVTAALGFPQGAVVPTGNVEFRLGSTVLATVPLDVQGKATWTFAGAAWDTGTYSIKAVYAGDSNYLPSEGTSQLTIQKAASTLSMSTDRTIAKAGQAVQVSGSLSFAGGFGTSGRTVKLFVDGTEVASTQTSANGSYTFSISNLAVGSRTLLTRYAGETNFLADDSNPVQVNVTPSATPVLGLAAPSSAVYGQSVNLVASVDPAYAVAYEGINVSFFGNGGLLGTAAFRNGTATFPFVAAVNPGTVQVTASVPLTSLYPSVATSQASNLQVGRANVSISWTIESGIGGTPQWVITVSAATPGSGIPSGMIRIQSRIPRSPVRVLRLVDGKAVYRYSGRANTPASIMYLGSTNFNPLSVQV